MSQCEKILEYMKLFGRISPADALREFGCMRLAARISDLEHKGYMINHIPESSVNRFGDVIHYMTYELVA